MQTWTRWILGLVLAIDVVFVIVVFVGRSAPAWAQADETAELALPPPNEWTAEAIETLGAELARRAEALRQKESELQELLRGNEVLQRAGLLDTDPAEPEGPDPAEAAALARAEDERRTEEQAKRALAEASFGRLQKAYENMEPDSAARALEELAKKDQQAVVQLVLGWQPRTSGAILDALTQSNPALAADLSYEIWDRSGKPGKE